MVTALKQHVVESELERELILDSALTQDRLELTIFPTEKCNFRCVYCYEDFAIGRMKPAIIAGIMRLLDNRAVDLQHLQISWFGGEPLLAYPVMKQLCTYAQELASSFKFSFISNITTNGYALDEARLLEMTGFGIRHFQISLDGDAAAHNTTRLRADGAGTFDTIWANLVLFNRLADAGLLHNAKVLVRVHLHPDNIASVEALIERIKANLNPKHFNIFLKNIGHYGGANDANVKIFEGDKKDYIDITHRIYEDVADYLEPSTDKTYVCYASKANAFLIRADGTLAKCTVALADSRNSIGRILENGQLQLADGKLAPWLHALDSMNTQDLGCPVMNLAKV